jgi:hypothetical protein
LRNSLSAHACNPRTRGTHALGRGRTDGMSPTIRSRFCATRTKSEFRNPLDVRVSRFGFFLLWRCKTNVELVFNPFDWACRITIGLKARSTCYFSLRAVPE